MNKLLGASWKPKVIAFIALVGPTGLFALLTAGFKVNTDQATAISGGVFALLASLGLYTAKQDGVSNSPTPLAVAHPVIPIAPGAPANAPAVLAQPVPIQQNQPVTL